MNRDSADKNVLNAYSGGQIIVAKDNATVYAVQNNGITSNIIHQPVKSRTQEYADKWDANMFLNNFSKRDEHAGVNVKLSEVYLDEQLPHYIWRENKGELSDLKNLLSEYIDESNANKMLLILGHPGIGKSTLITWITANLIDDIDRIFVYSFSKDLNGIDWQSLNNEDIFEKILSTLNLTYDSLYGKTLILDGFDEVNIGDFGFTILKQLYSKLIKNCSWYKVSIIITCRVNYIYDIYKAEYDYITLQPWDEAQIRNFYMTFQSITNSDMSIFAITDIIENKEILGIPLILYMILALDIVIEEKDFSIVDVYDKIFSLEGGIYDRCIDNKSFADIHRIAAIKKQIHQISGEIAIWIFENNPSKACIPKIKYQEICLDVMQNQEQKDMNVQQDFKIGNYFKLIKHCDGIETEELYFVHRSIYEYFVADTIYNSIEKPIQELSTKSQEELAGNIAYYLKKGRITPNINKCLLRKIKNSSNILYDAKREKLYQWWEETVIKMMTVGMFYYTKRSIQDYKNIIICESECFMNLIIILRLFHDEDRKGFILKNVDRNILERYIRIRLIECGLKSSFGTEILNLSNFYLNEIDLSRENLEKINFSEANLEGANFSEASLKEACFEKANLQTACLVGSDFSRAYLECADLRGADITRICLRGAHLKNVIMDEDQVKYLKEICDLRGTKVFINETNKIIKYEEYCKEEL